VSTGKAKRNRSEAKRERSEVKNDEKRAIMKEFEMNKETMKKLRNRHELGRLQNMNSHARKHHLLYARFLCHRQKQISLINKIPPSL
jgi:hypothetical protein